jgi:predicted  nucleic acid-binding Zn-ribbon protein/DNA-directed RNA polymerase subunit RPC12/RpoP
MPANAEIKFECSECGQRLSVDAAAAGIEISCPACQSSLSVPHPRAFHQEGEAFTAEGGENLRGEQQGPHSGADQDLIALRDQLVEATLSRGRLERDMAAAQVEIESLGKHVGALTEQRDALIRNLEEARMERESVAAEFDAVRRESDRLRTRCAALETEKEVSARALEEKTGALDGALIQLRQLQEQVAELTPKLQSALHDASLAKKDVAASGDAAAFRALRERAEKAEAAQLEIEARLARADEASGELRSQVLTLSQEKESWKERCTVAEQRVLSLSESQLQKDNTVLRSILERQKVEMEQRFKELKRLRRGQFGVRIAYALFGLALVVLVLIIVPHLKEIGSWFTG